MQQALIGLSGTVKAMHREILALALPNILTNLAVPLLGIVDTALMGRLDAVSYLGAIAIGSMIFNFIYWLFGFLRMGTTGFTAQAHGRQDEAALTGYLVRPLLLAAGIGMALIALQVPLAGLSFWVVEASPAVEQFARAYFIIRIWAAPATLMLYVLNGWFLGRQNARYPMYLAFFGNSVNILVSGFCVWGLGLKTAGVAWGTLCAQYLTLFLALGLLTWRYRGLWSHVKGSLRHWQDMGHFFRVNRDIFVRTLCLLLTFGFFTAESARYGETLLAVNTILLQFLSVMAYGVDGFAFAAESLVGKVWGADKGTQPHELKPLIRRLFLWGEGLGLLFAGVYGLCFTPLFYLFTDKPHLLLAALPFVPWVVLGSLINSFCFIWDGIYLGATASRPMRNTMLLSVFGVFFPVYYLVQPFWGIHALWLAMMAFMASRGLSLTWTARRYLSVTIVGLK